MDYPQQKKIQVDPLNFIYVLGYKIFQSRSVKFLLKPLFCYYSFLILIQVDLFFSNPSTTQLIRYGPFFLQISYALLTIVVHLTKSNLVDNAMGSLILWNYQAAGTRAKTKIEKDSKVLKHFIILNVFLGLLWPTLVICFDQNETELLSRALFSKKWFPRSCTYIAFIFKCFCYLTSFSMIAHPQQIVYAMQHVKFQTHLLNKFIEAIECDFNDSKTNLIYNKLFQEEVECRLKIIVKRHCDLLRWRRHTLELMSDLIVPFSLSAAMILLSVALSFFQLDQETPKNLIFRYSVFAVYAALAFVSVITSGQMMENMSAQTLSMLTQTKWYTWSCKNRKILLLLLRNNNEPISLRLTHSISINYHLGLGILKLVYSAVSVFFKML